MIKKERVVTLMDSRTKLAKDFVNCIASKQELAKILSDIPLTEDEYRIASLIIIEKKAVPKVAIDTGYAESSIKRKTKDIYLKIYDRLFTGYYKNTPQIELHNK